MAVARLFIGLISGTSADAIDAALISIDGEKIRTRATANVSFDPLIKAMLDDALAAPLALTAQKAGYLDSALGDAFAGAVMTLLSKAGTDANQITAIGSHGQTVFHEPSGPYPFTLQVGDGARIAAQTGINVINDFRRADVANGGEGAPLAPLLHDQLLRSTEHDRVIVNLGGIANITVLARGAPTSGFDTGPANTLMDSWARWCGIGDYDKGGTVSANGRVDAALLDRLMLEPFLAVAPPKSTGRELFNARWLQDKLNCDADNARKLSANQQADIMATLCAFTTATVANAIREHAPKADQVIICGGGALNPTLMTMLASHLSSFTVTSSDAFGIDSQFVEAVLFAWLASQHVSASAIDTRRITGSRQSIIAGTQHFAPEASL